MQSVPHPATTDNGHAGAVGDAYEPEASPLAIGPTLGAFAPGAGLNPLDAASLRLAVGGLPRANKVLLAIPVRKPTKEEFFRVHPDEAYTLPIAMIELKGERSEVYAVAPALAPELGDESTLSHRLVVTAINRKGDLFLWPLKLPSGDRKSDSWPRSALEAANLARTSWTRMQANMGTGMYDVYKATGNLPEPEWPDLTIDQIVALAFRDSFINSLDHVVLRGLRGEV
jgi:hypothetical protein